MARDAGNPAATWHDLAGDKQTRRGASSVRWRCCVVATSASPRSVRGRLLVSGHLQQSLHRTGRYAAQHLPAPCGGRDGRDAAVRQTGDQTDQESRSASPEPQLALTAMDITIHSAFLPHDDGRIPGLLPRHPRLRDPQRRRIRRDALDHGRPPQPVRHVHRPVPAGRHPRHHRTSPCHRRPRGVQTLGADCRFRASPFVLARPYSPGRCDPRLQE